MSPSNMIIYNVTINIDEEVADEWLNYMKENHIPDVMKTSCFIDSTISRLLTSQSDETGRTYAVQYRCLNMAKYKEYEDKFAPELQKEHSELYSGKFVAFRSLMEVV